MADPVTVGLMVGGTLLQAYGTKQSIDNANATATATAIAQNQMAEYQAKQLKANAGAERATAQHKMVEQDRQKNLALSRAQAVAAAGGGGSLDPSIVDIMGDLEAEGEYNKALALFEGEERARDLESGANIKLYEGQQALTAGKNAQRSSLIPVAGSLLSGGSQVADSNSFKSLMAKYG